MKFSQAVLCTLAGGIAGAAISTSAHLRSGVVHAQDQFTTFGGCISTVPRNWGNFVGASTYGLAFEDDKGTLRFIQHPTCGNSFSSNSAAEATIDQEIVRK